MNVCNGVSVPHKPQVHILPLGRSIGFRVVAAVLVTFLKTGVLEEKAEGSLRGKCDAIGMMNLAGREFLSSGCVPAPNMIGRTRRGAASGFHLPPSGRKQARTPLSAA